jgi:hypothetical protein
MVSAVFIEKLSAIAPVHLGQCGAIVAEEWRPHWRQLVEAVS